MKMTLSKLGIGLDARVVRLEACGPLQQRLLALGLLPGMSVKLVRVAPLGDPIAIEFQNQCVALRKAEADSIEVELLEK
ncbi:MAG: ferrous iron transport protein A [Puniceicoccales bacterium]|jgi:Fe2+ transport system protein FeoA|nr:ferrous iron transport protein A [Puniceicoccales bacterium]